MTHPKNKGDRKEYQNKKTGDKIGFDPGKEGKSGWEGINHWHRYNPASQNKRDLYLDKNGNRVGKGSDASHIEAPIRKVHPVFEFNYKVSWFEKNIQNPINDGINKEGNNEERGNKNNWKNI